MSINSTYFNNLLVTRGNASGRNMNPYTCTTDQKSEREHTMTVVPVMLLVVFFMLWELQMLPVSQVQLCVGFRVG